MFPFDTANLEKEIRCRPVDVIDKFVFSQTHITSHRSNALHVRAKCGICSLC